MVSTSAIHRQDTYPPTFPYRLTTFSASKSSKVQRHASMVPEHSTVQSTSSPHPRRTPVARQPSKEGLTEPSEQQCEWHSPSTSPSLQATSRATEVRQTATFARRTHSIRGRCRYQNYTDRAGWTGVSDSPPCAMAQTHSIPQPTLTSMRATRAYLPTSGETYP